LAKAQKFTRDLVTTFQQLTPKNLAEKARAMAKEAGLPSKILDEKKIAS